VGVLLAIEGIDGSGKGTQAGRLVETARERGRSVALFSFPTYDGNPFSGAIAEYLNGQFGSADDVHPKLAAMLYAADRFHARGDLVDAVAERDLVVCDRYVGSNAAHQGAKLDGDAREELLAWLEEVEYGELALPRPDLVVLLDAPVALARERVGQKPARGYTALEADIHEADTEHTSATRDLYLELARRRGWLLVSTGERGADEVTAEIWSAVEPLLP
jgi:dTMP kinase